jgi:hypothetical protein
MVQDLTAKERRFLSKLNTPEKMQAFLDGIGFNDDKRLSAVDVLRKKKGDCIESACLAAYVLRKTRYDPRLLDFTSVHDDDHVVCVFKERGLYGAIGQSKFLGLRYRHPVYRTIRELAMSYYDNYFNFSGIFDLETYSRPYKLDHMPDGWIYSAKAVHQIEKKLDSLKHYRCAPTHIKQPPATRLQFKREIIFLPSHARIAKRYK